MAQTLTTPAEAPGGSPVRLRGVLALASPAPSGWEVGGIQVSEVCPTPRISAKCGVPDAVEAPSPSAAEFFAFTVDQGSGCSTLSGSDREREARDALEASTDYALGLMLYGSEESPSLSDATDLGSIGGPVATLSALECAAVAAGRGQFYVIHASVPAANYLAAAGLIDESGRTPSGAPVIVSAGYPCSSEAPQLWATGRVWAAAGAIDTHSAVNRRDNNQEAWAVRSAIVGFNTCINVSASLDLSASEVAGYSSSYQANYA